MDWVTAITGIGTLVVAIVALYTVWTTDRQLRILEKQALFQRSDVYPLIEVRSKSVVGNSVNLQLRNRGRGPAFEIALHSSYFPIRTVSGSQEFGTKFHATDSEGSALYGPLDGATFLKNSNAGSRLYEGEEDTFVVEARFLGDAGTGGKGESFSKFFSYAELRPALTKDGFDSVGISLAVACKDITESYVDEHPLYALIADLRKHDSLEDVVRDGVRFAAIALHPEQLEWLSWEMYAHSKTVRGFLEDPFRKFRERP
jgi:hypothetical protein